MLSMYEWLMQRRNYSFEDAELTLLLEGTDFPLPTEVVRDLRDYYSYVLEEDKKRRLQKEKGGKK